MSDLVRRHAANVLTGARVALTPAFVAAVWSSRARPIAAHLAVAVFVVVAASDFFDGRLARRYGRAGDAGRFFDHFADIGFILAALSTYVVMGLAPWWVPAAIAGSFGFYVIDSWLRSGGRPRLISSRIGHAGGVMNYVFIGILVFNDTAGIRLLSPALTGALFWLVPIYSMAAVAARLLPVP